MLTLSNLRNIRVQRGLQRHHIAAATGLSLDRIKSLEVVAHQREPWLSEAYSLHIALGTVGIMQLIDGQDVLTINHGLDIGVSLPTDIAMHRSGARLPLSLACRIALELGLPDPAYVYRTDALFSQVWEIIEQNERGAPAGVCPYCMADRRSGAAHARHCLPNSMWAPPRGVLPVGPLPRVSVRGKLQGSGQGHGLRRERERAGMTQKQLAEAVRMNSNHYARVERGVDSLTTRKAEMLALILRCDVNDLYRKDDV